MIRMNVCMYVCLFGCLFVCLFVCLIAYNSLDKPPGTGVFLNVSYVFLGLPTMHCLFTLNEELPDDISTSEYSHFEDAIKEAVSLTLSIY